MGRCGRSVSGRFRERRRNSLALLRPHTQPVALVNVGQLGRYTYGALLMLGACASCREPTGVDSRYAPRECWYAADSGAARSIPAIVGSTVVHATGSNTIVGRDSATGARRWESAILPRASRGYELVAGGGVVVVLHNATASGLEGNSGAVRWSYTTPTDQGQAGTVAGNTPAADSAYAYVPAWGASVSAVDLRTGVARWIWRTPDTASTRAGAVGVAIAGDTVYATVWKWITPTGTVTEQWLVALDRRSGVELWREVFTEPLQFVNVFNAPVVSGRVVTFNLLNGQVIAIDRFTRQRLWDTPARVGGEAVVHSLVVVGDTIFIPESDRAITARSIEDGRVLWVQSGAQGLGALAAAGTRLYVGSGPYLTALDRTTGRVLWAGRIPAKPGVPSWNRYIAPMLGSPSGRIFAPATGGTFCLRE